jgi:hypothetical protein
MADKTLQEWRKYYRKNFPTWPDEEVEVRAKFSFQAQEWENAGSPSGNPLDPKTWNKTGTTGTSGSNPVVGRKPTPTPSPTATPKPTAVPPGLGVSIAEAAKNTQLNITPPSNVAIDTVNFVSSLTKAQMKQIIPWLDKFGASKADISTVGNAKKYLQNNFSTYVENAGNSVTKLIQLFKDDYIPSAGDADKVKPSGVTQYITEKSPELLKKDVDKFLLEKVGSTNIKEESRQKIMDEINKMIAAGTTTVSKMDKTGKVKTVQSVGYSEERAGAVVERVAKELEPEKYEQQKQLNFFDFMQQAEQMRGGR